MVLERQAGVISQSALEDLPRSCDFGASVKCVFKVNICYGKYSLEKLIAHWTLIPYHLASCMRAWRFASVNSVTVQLCDRMECSPPGSSAHGILQARILEWVAVPFSRGSSRPRNRTSVSYVSCIGRWHLTYYQFMCSLISVSNYGLFSYIILK